ncbi:MAG: phage baseplate assembly protein V [Thauera sp.]|jgi:phage baseplate assembly protein gpV
MSDIIESSVERLVERAGTSYFGKYRGIVTNVDDPLNQCRVRARVDGLLHGQETGWALPVAPFAGDGHGMVMLPAVGAGVWIEFEAGRLDNPIWSGGWWASGQRPEPQGAALRVIVSEHGHTVILDDRNDELKLVHGSAGGPEIRMTGSEIVLTCGACEITISADSISLNNGQIKIGLAGLSLVNGAMSFGVPP